MKPEPQVFFLRLSKYMIVMFQGVSQKKSFVR
jgi:hypothetical protein